MTGKTAKIPLQTSPKVAAKVVTKKVNKAPTNMRQARSFDLILGGELGFMRGSKNGVSAKELVAISNAKPRFGEVVAKTTAKTNHAAKAKNRANCQLKRIHAQE
jgi:hypothetical protein